MGRQWSSHALYVYTYKLIFIDIKQCLARQVTKHIGYINSAAIIELKKIIQRMLAEFIYYVTQAKSVTKDKVKKHSILFFEVRLS